MAYTVVDVSQWNGKIDWETAKNHIDGAIIRCGFGSDYSSQDDPYWDYNVGECERLGIPFGVYLYSYAHDTDMARSEADHAIRLCAGHKLSYPLYFDTEESGTEWASRECAIAFCEAVKDAGYTPGVYTFRSWFNSYLDGFDDYTLWIADFGANDGYPGTAPYIGVAYDAWQYTSVGTVPGINGSVDISEFYFAPGAVEVVNVADIAATIHANMCEDDRFGYSWDPRWGTDGAGYATWTIHGREYTVKCGDYDCSSSIITAWSTALQGTEYEGALDNATYTGNMRSVFTASGLFEVWDTDTTSAVRGDVYLNETHHTAMCQDGGNDGVYGYDALSEFAINENGGVYGGSTGDQTGRESYVHGYYDYPWDLTLHYNHKADFEEDDMALSDSDIQKIKLAVWEYIYPGDTVMQELGREGDPNRYNTLDAAALEAHAALAAVNELAAKVDALSEKIESINAGSENCALAKILKQL